MTATLNGRLCTSVDLIMPIYGNWSARVQLGDADALATTPAGASLAVAGLKLTGTVVEQGERSSQRSAEIVGGFGGWALSVPPLPHGLTANGVKLSAYVTALARAAGETLAMNGDALVIASGSDRPLGTVVARLGQQGAGELLSEVCASPSGAPVIPWWVGLDGVTNLGTRTGVDSDPEFTDQEALDRWRVYTLDDATDLLPGGTIAGRTIAEIRIEATGDNVSVRALLETPGAITHTFAAKMRRLMLGFMGPRVSARTIYKYIVTRVYPNYRIAARPVRSLLAPNFDSVQFWPGLPGGRGIPREGSQILVKFADGDIGSPVCVGFTPANDGTLGIAVLSEVYAETINLAGTTPVARVGDFAGRLIFDAAVATLYYSPGSAPTPYVPVATNPQTPNPPLGTDPGTDITITTGSAVVNAG